MGRLRKHPIPDGVVLPARNYSHSTGYLYAAELDNNTVKIGFSRAPWNRIRTLGASSRRHWGASVKKFTTGPAMDIRAALKLEQIALREYRKQFSPLGVRLGEFFPGADFATAARLIGAPEAKAA